MQKDPGDELRKKREVCEKFIQRLVAVGHPAATTRPDFAQELHAYFATLPTRYALDVNVESAEDLLVHKQLLELAKVPENRPAFSVRAVQVLPVGLEDHKRLSSPSLNGTPKQEDFLTSTGHSAPKQSVHPPSFGSFPNLEALALKLNKAIVSDEVKGNNGDYAALKSPHKPMHEVTFSTLDKPKLLSQLSSVLADIGLNIREAHVFCTTDGYSLDAFVVDGWPTEDTQDLHQALENALSNLKKGYWERHSPQSSPPAPGQKVKAFDADHLKIPSDGIDDWEIQCNQLQFNNQVASGSFGDLYRGIYYGQDVAIKVLKPERLNDNLQREFAQEVYIMRKVRHKNVVRFIGACTRPPNLCIVTEFMVGGSIYDYLHKRRGKFKLPRLLRVAIDISKGMDYLHQNNIIHRDLKSANLLMDENEVIKVADFGVARVQDQSGIMTAETGTYRWMAPEVIEHKPYDRKADVFSFAIVLWELLTGKTPYDYLTPLQAAVGVVQEGLRPAIPENTDARISELLQKCWQKDPTERHTFADITLILQDILKEVCADVNQI